MAIKLTKAQQEVLDLAKREIDYARTHDFLHWIAKDHGYALETDWDAYPNPYLSNENALREAQEMVEADSRPTYTEEGYEIRPAGWSRQQYEKRKTGIVFTITSSHTLRALETRGLIRIIKDAKRGVDEIQVLNY